jgi:metal-responsive CopG/Arc/MetJ family transcriptional regulator
MEALMQVTRVTIALPKKLWESVKKTVPAGKRSRLVAQALESELRRRQRAEQASHLREFQHTMRAKYGELPSSADDIDTMRGDRPHE